MSADHRMVVVLAVWLVLEAVFFVGLFVWAWRSSRRGGGD